MNKHLIILLLMSVALTSCRDDPLIKPTVCGEPENLKSIFIKSINQIGEMPSPIAEGEIKSLIRPLTKAFNIDLKDQCVGYTQQVKDAAVKILKQRSDEVKPTLHHLCGERPDVDITDVSLLASIEEIRRAARAALEVLHEQTSDCVDSSQ